MSGGKETPRQKMIGMMYLVLTALLALNVSKDILNAFIVVEEGITKTNQNFDSKNELIYNAFKMAMLNDEAKTKPFYDKAQIVRQKSKELDKFIAELKVELYMEVEGIPKGEADTMTVTSLPSKDNYDAPTHFLIGENPEKATGKAKDLKEKIDKYRKDLLDLIPEKDKANLKLSLNTEDVYSPTEGKKISWENNAFYHSPMAAVITILSKVQNDVKNAEGDIINLLYQSISADAFKFDKLEAKVIPNTNYVLLGEEYKADLFVAAFNTTQNPTILIGKVDTATNKIIGNTDSIREFTGGMGKYTVRPSSEGPMEWSGIIRVKNPSNPNDIKSYPFKSAYMVAKPALVVSPTKMNVLYIGVDNPIDISVPGVAAENLQPSLSGGTLSGSRGSYIARVQSGTEATVNVSAKLGEGTKSMGSFKFRVKRVPDPVAYIAGKKGDQIIAKGELMTISGIMAKLENFDFDLNFVVTSFTLSGLVKGNIAEYKSTSNKLTPEMSNFLKMVGPGAKIYFEQIKAIGPDKVPRDLSSVSMKVK